MDTNSLIGLRRQAEEAVADMPEGPIKTKAFEIIFTRLVEGGQEGLVLASTVRKSTGSTDTNRNQHANPASLLERILVLKSDGFFEKQRNIAEVRENLSSRGWHYPVTSLSGALQTLVQRGELRRMRVKESGKEVWKYSIP